MMQVELWWVCMCSTPKLVGLGGGAKKGSVSGGGAWESRAEPRENAPQLPQL